MFTVNRFDRLLLVLASWDGPMTAVLYASPEEVLQLSALISQSDDNHRLRDVTIHVVYRNGARKNEVWGKAVQECVRYTEWTAKKRWFGVIKKTTISLLVYKSGVRAKGT